MTWFTDERFWQLWAALDHNEAYEAHAGVEVDAMLRLTSAPRRASVLDLGCGPGRHAVELARRGHAVTAVDLQPSFLRQASRRAAEAGVEVSTVESDLRHFVREDAFDAISSLWTSFGYWDDPSDDLVAARNMARSLRRGARLCLEVFAKEIEARHYHPRNWRERAGVLLLTEKKIHDGGSRITERWTFLTDRGRETFEMAYRAFTGPELASLLEAAGLVDVAIHGDLDGSPYGADSRRLVGTGRRP